MKFSDAFGMLSVKDPAYGAVGDGVTDDTTAIQNCLNAAFGSPASPHEAALATSNRVVIFPPGDYKITSQLNLENLCGARIIGSGRFTTRIANHTNNGSVFVTDGCGFSHFEGMRLSCVSGTGVCFDLDWDGTGGGGSALQSNTFMDMHFDEGAYGVRIANSGVMGSENLFLNCYWNSQSVAGLYCGASNALQNSVVGGNMAACAIGIWVGSGSVPYIQTVGFQESTSYDIKIEWGGYNTNVVTGCRSESNKFCYFGGGSFVVNGCGHETSTGLGIFVENVGCAGVIQGCSSSHGKIKSTFASRMKILNCFFAQLDWKSIAVADMWYVPNNRMSTLIEVENTTAGPGTLITQIKRQKIYTLDGANITTRTYDIEATALTDTSFAYESGVEAFTVTIASPGVFTFTSHGLTAGSQVALFNNGDTLPTGLTFAKTYYVISAGLTTDAFELSLTSGGAAINTTGSQSGTHKLGIVRNYQVGDQVTKSNAAAGGSPGWICTTAGPALADNAASVALFKALANVAA